LKHKRKSPVNAIIPCKINRDTLFSLDVDNSIWDSRGLGEDTGHPPLWMMDEDVITGIRGWLQSDRCQEESARLVAERRQMQLWSHGQWYLVTIALLRHVHPDIRYQLFRRQEALLQLIDEWSSAVSAIPGELEDGWGPSPEDLTAFRRRRQLRVIKVNAHVQAAMADAEWSDDEDNSDLDAGPDCLLEVVDDFYLDDLFDDSCDDVLVGHDV
jgi:hypothetical protein